MPRKKFKLFKPRKKRQEATQQNSLDSLPVPNHMQHPSLYDVTDDLLGNKHDGIPFFPLLQLALTEAPDSGTAKTLAFLDERYGIRSWRDYCTFLDLCKACSRTGSYVALQNPPTWMDPEIFVRMVDKHPRLRGLIQMYLKKGNSGKRIKMNELLQQVFEDEYLVYMFEQFGKVRDLLAQWVIAHYVEEERNASRRKKRRTKSP